MRIEPYLNFDGRGEEAIEFYKKALGAKVEMLLRVKDSPEPPQPGMIAPGSENKVMHASLRIDETRILISDGRCSASPTFKGISLSLGVASDADAQRYFNGLSEGGKVTMPLTKTFFASSFGMVTDRFGVSWMVVVNH